MQQLDPDIRPRPTYDVERGHRSRWPRMCVAIRAIPAIGLGISGVGLLPAPAMTQAQDGPSRIDADGAIHVRELTIPPSDLWSPEFRDFYARWAAGVSERADIRVPSRGAPKAEWEKYDARNQAYLAERLARVLEHYPVDVVDTMFAGVRVGIITPRGGISPSNERRVLINLRGGGFVTNRGLSFGQLESIPVAAIGQMKVITVDYRQAPFHGYPAATEDVAGVYRQLLKQYQPEAIGIFGCSAGGVLTAQAVAWFQAEGLPRPGAVGISCSAAEPLGSRGMGDSGIWLSPPIPRSRLSEADRTAWGPAGWYMEGVDPDDATAYPGSSDAVLAGFPPTLWLSGTRDYAMSAAIVAHARLLKLGVQSSLYIIEGAPHAAHVIAVGTPEAHDAFAYIAQWFDQHLAR